jgi:AraC family L-rhamnose operon transcriptional activator RhaR
LASTRTRARYDRAAVFNPDGLPVWADRHRLAGDIAAHDHDFLEIALITQGTAVHISADGDYPVRPGSAVVVPPNEWHGYSDCADLVVFDCFVAPELIDGTLSFLDQELPLLRTVHAGLTASWVPRIQLSAADLSRSLGELHSISNISADQRSRVQVVGHLLVYLDILDRAWPERDAWELPTGVRRHPAAIRAMQLMERDLAHSWTLSELAAAVAVERTHLVRLFRRSAGIPPMAYLNRRRAQVAAALLVRTDQPVAGIGARLGWTDPAYFARRFRAVFGLSPSAYRTRALSGTVRSHEPSALQTPLPISGARYAGKKSPPAPANGCA